MSDGHELAEEALRSTADAVYWLQQQGSVPTRPELTGDATADIAVVGGGLTGLWAAIRAKQRYPDRDVMLLERSRIGAGGSGRSGGFLSESLTHGLAYGAHLWPDEIATLVTLGRANLDAIADFVRDEGIDADLQLCGKTSVATESHHIEELSDERELYREHGMHATFLGQGGIRADIDSPLVRAGLRLPEAGGLVDPARLTLGLADSAAAREVRIREATPVRSIRDRDHKLALRCPQGTVTANQVIVATNAFPAPVRRIRKYIVPLWDHVLVTEPLSDAQWKSVGWSEGQGCTDNHRRFHYFRPTPDGRILWGGFGTAYYFSGRAPSRVQPTLRHHTALARHFFELFPQLRGLRFTHRWSGAIDSTTRLTPLFGTEYDGRLGYAVGFSGLGVASSRFAADVVLDLLEGADTDRVNLDLVQSAPRPVPPEPLRWPLVRLTQRAKAKADENDGRRGPWLDMLERRGYWLDS